MFKIMIDTVDGDYEYATFDTEAEAQQFGDQCGWEMRDENNFSWDMWMEEA